MIGIRWRVVAAVTLAAGVMFLVWAWDTRIWGAAYRPWDGEAALIVERVMQDVARDAGRQRMGAQQTLARAGSGAARPLIPYLDHEDFRLRRLAAVALGYVGDWSVVDDLALRLDDPHPEVRKACVLALHRIASSHALEPLRRHATDRDMGTRAAIAVALGDLGDLEDVAVLVGLVGDEQVPVRQMAVVSLGRLGDAGAIPALVACLDDPMLRTRSAAVRSLSLCTGIPEHDDGNLWLAWWAVNRHRES